MAEVLHETVSKILKESKTKNLWQLSQTEFKAVAQQKQHAQLHTLSK